jgi:thiol:disulfide interchange protein DsbD
MRAQISLILLAFSAAVCAEPVRTPHVEAELLAPRTAIEPGKPLVVALRLKIAPNWHTYWRNPGDSGEPTRITWKLPPGYSAGAIQWPVPERLPAGPLTNFGYKNEVLLLTDVAVPQGASGPVTLAARADWLVCNPERCIPEGADLAITFSGNANARTAWAEAIERAQALLPRKAAEVGPWRFDARGAAGAVVLDIVPPAGIRLASPVYFPYEEGRIDNSAAQPVERAGDAYRLTIPASRQPVGAFTRVAGLLAVAQPLDAQGRRAVEFSVPVTGLVGPAAAAPPAPESAPLGLAMALAFAFLGGLILNLMPCVLPVLSIKVLGFVSNANQGAAQRRLQGALFAAGVVGSFLLLAAVLIALKAGGTALGWGYQLQSPLFVSVLALFFFALALNLSGVFEFGNVLPASLSGARVSSPRIDALLSGALAVFVASPCTAPFMGAALGFAFSQSVPVTMLIFTALGLGMAAPYALLAWNPRWLGSAPAPGPWMTRLKQFLAFPLYATVIWLAWVLGTQSGLDAVIALLAALLALAVTAWLAGLATRRKLAVRAIATAFALAAAALAVHAARAPAPGTPAISSAESAAAAWQPYTRQRLAELTAAGTPVFVDFTAAWCVTCQVNKQLVLTRPDVERAFTDRGVARLRADWTRRDDEITRALAELGRNGVPVYALYLPGRSVRLLPEILTRETVLAALAEIGHPKSIANLKRKEAP